MAAKRRWGVLLLVVAGLTGSATAVQYTVTDLGTFGERFYTPNDINNFGQVVGYSSDGNGGNWRGFLYSNGAMTDLGPGIARGINDIGQVVGNSSTTNCAFLYTGGVMQNLGTLRGSYSDACGINRNGQIVGGASTTGNTDYHAFLYSNGDMQDLGTLGNKSSSGYRINASGQVAGSGGIDNPYSGGDSYAFLYSEGAMHNLGTLGGTSSWARGINDSGQVVGYSHIAGDTASHPFLYSGGTMHDLGTLGGGGNALDINASGQVVGDFDAAGYNRAFLYSDGTMVDLNTLLPAGSGWVVTRAEGINDAGQIMAQGYIPATGQVSKFLLVSPAFPGDANKDGKVSFWDYLVLEYNFGKTNATWEMADFNGDGKVSFADYLLLEQNFGKSSVPEPATLSLLALGGLGLLRRRK